jgi:hypothetical protein
MLIPFEYLLRYILINGELFMIKYIDSAYGEAFAELIINEIDLGSIVEFDDTENDQVIDND